MHSELVAIQALWEVDEALDSRHGRLKALEQAILGIEQEVSERRTEAEETSQSRAVLAAEEK
ncbi:MAG: hypothetical protein QGG40_17090, partial [Myxococcota bacterium]|nr:hypothetical protein [Myxococcota bacterium]